MTLDAAPSEIVHQGAGTRGPFAIPFRFPVATDLEVRRRTAAGVVTLLASGIDFSTSGAGDPAGGALTLVDPLLAGSSLIIRRLLALTQPMAFVENDILSAAALEGAFDRLGMLAQEVGRRAVQAAPGDEATGPQILPRLAERAGRFAGYDAAGRPSFGRATMEEVDAAVARATSPGSGTGTSLPTPRNADYGRVLKAGAGSPTWGQVDAAEVSGLGTAATRDTGTAPGEILAQDATGQARIGWSIAGTSGVARLAVSAVERGDIALQGLQKATGIGLDLVVNDADPTSARCIRFSDLGGINGWIAAERGDVIAIDGAYGLALSTQGGSRRLEITGGGALALGGATPAPGHALPGDLTLPASRAVRARNVAKAWVSFNGTGTVAVRDAFNVASITDNGVGDYTINFQNAMTDANYAVAGSSSGASGNPVLSVHASPGPATTGVRVLTTSYGSNTDASFNSVLIMGL